MLLGIWQCREHVLDVITRHRCALMALLQRRRQERPAYDDLASRLVDDAVVVRAEADLRWLDLCEERLTAQSKEKGRR